MFKVYKIVNDINDDIYIGSTKQPLYKRFHDHKNRSKKIPDMNNLYKLMNEIGDNHFRIIEIERFEYIDKEYQFKKEQEFIDLYKPVLNKIDAYALCIHNKRKYYCVECSGNGICPHNKQKNRCKECGGNGICEHNKEKYICVECCGTGICPHSKRKSDCLECGGNAICIHNIIKYSCKTCGGSAVCIHNKYKARCKTCGGSAYCVHNKLKTTCNVCSPVICEFCNKTYSKSYIKKHIKNLHNQ